MTKQEIIALRKSLGMTQAKFAEAIGGTVTSVSRWETGVTKPSRLYIKEMRSLKGKNGTEIR